VISDVKRVDFGLILKDFKEILHMGSRVAGPSVEKARILPYRTGYKGENVQGIGLQWVWGGVIACLKARCPCVASV
jgi:hypothetical protein